MAFIPGPSYNPSAAASQYDYWKDWGNYLSKHRDQTQADKIQAWKFQLQQQAAQRAEEAHKQSIINAKLLEEERRQDISDAQHKRKLLEDQEAKFLSSDERWALERKSKGMAPPRPTFAGTVGSGPSDVDPLLAAAAGGPGWGSAMAPNSLPPTEEEQGLAQQKLAEGTRRYIALNLATLDARLSALREDARKAELHGNKQILHKIEEEYKRTQLEYAKLQRAQAEDEAKRERKQRSVADEFRLEAFGGASPIEDEIFGNLDFGVEQLEGLDIASDRYRTILQRLASMPTNIGGINSGTYNAYLAESDKAREQERRLKTGVKTKEQLEQEFRKQLSGRKFKDFVPGAPPGMYGPDAPKERVYPYGSERRQEFLNRGEEQGTITSAQAKSLSEMGVADAVVGKVKTPDTEYGISKATNRKDIGKTLDNVIKEAITGGKGKEYLWSGEGNIIEESLDQEERSDIISTLFEYARQLKKAGKEDGTLPYIVEKIINQIGLPATPGDRIEGGIVGFSNYEDYIPMTMDEIKSAYEGNNKEMQNYYDTLRKKGYSEEAAKNIINDLIGK